MWLVLYLFILRLSSAGPAASSTAPAATTTATPAASAETPAKTSSTTGVVRHLLHNMKKPSIKPKCDLNVRHMIKTNARVMHNTRVQSTSMLL